MSEKFLLSLQLEVDGHRYLIATGFTEAELLAPPTADTTERYLLPALRALRYKVLDVRKWAEKEIADALAAQAQADGAGV